MRLLSSLLTRFIQNGTLRLVDAGGRVHLFGGNSPGPSVALRLHDRALHTKLALNPELHTGEAYMNGTLTFEEWSGISDLMYLFSFNRGGMPAHGSHSVLRGWWRAAYRWHQAYPAGLPGGNARHQHC